MPQLSAEAEVVSSSLAYRDANARPIEFLDAPERAVLAHDIRPFDDHVGTGEEDLSGRRHSHPSLHEAAGGAAGASSRPTRESTSNPPTAWTAPKRLSPKAPAPARMIFMISALCQTP